MSKPPNSGPPRALLHWVLPTSRLFSSLIPAHPSEQALHADLAVSATGEYLGAFLKQKHQ